MQIKSSKRRFRKLLIPLGIILLAVAGSLVYVYAFDGSIFGWNNGKESSENSTNLDKPTDEQKRAGDEAKENTVNDSKSSSNNTDTPAAPQQSTDSGKSTVDVQFTAAAQNEDILQLRLLIATIDNSGSCTLTLTLTGGQKSVSKTSDTQAQSNTSTCKGFDIPVSELGQGTWQAVVKYNGSKTTGSATTSVQIK